MENFMENIDIGKIKNSLPKSKTILTFRDFGKLEFRGFLITDRKNVAEVSGSLGKFYNVWNEADKLPF